jgi:predicted RND superfamily exporter protein
VIVAAAAAAGLGGVALATRLELRTDWAELLPQNEPSVKQMRLVQAKLPSMSALLVNISSPDRAANERFADALAAKLRALPPERVELVVSNFETEVSWMKAHAWLYARVADLAELRDRLQDEIARRKNPLLVDIDDDKPSVDDIRRRIQANAPPLGTLERGRLTTNDGHTASVIVIAPGGLFNQRAGEKLVEAVRRVLAELHPTGLEIGFSGEIESNLEERRALERDLVGATVLCLLLVCGVVWIYYGRARALVLMALPAALGTVLAFAVAELVFGHLNSSTAFLGSIILGNGINFAIIQMARYEEERLRGVAIPTALGSSLQMTVRATAVAALAASCAYGSLVVTRMRGFSQFGVIGGVGMLLCWGATVVVLPALLRLLDRDGTAPRRRGPLQARRLALLVTHHPRTLLLIAGAMTVAALAILPRRWADPFEYDFRRLRSARSQSTAGEGRWQDANEELFGRVLNPIILLAPNEADVEAAAAAALQRDRAAPPFYIDRVITAADLVPGSESEQREKVAILGQIRHLANDPAFDLLDANERSTIERNLPPAGLSPITSEDLPPLLRRPLSDREGRFGRIALVVPARHYSSWDGRDMIQLADRVGQLQLKDGTVVQGAGKGLVFADMIRAVVRDAPRAILTAAAGVMLVVLVLARGLRGSLLVLSALGLGMLWTLGAAGALNIKVNFLNFVALPITIGIGVDYAINVYLRYRLEGRGQAARAIAATGGAVALCSATTIIGYGSLLMADNRGLRSFGALAILGEVACLTAALLVVPALLQWRDVRTMHPAPGGAPVENAG